MMDLEVEFEVDDQQELDELDSLNNASDKKNAKSRRKRVKKKKPARSSTLLTAEKQEEEEERDALDAEKDQIEIEVVPEELELDTVYAELSQVMQHFKFVTAKVEIEKDEKTKKEEADAARASSLTKEAQLERLKLRLLEDEEDDEKMSKENDDKKPKLSKRKLKLASRLSVAALKQLVNRPDVVEMHDTTAHDPKLLVHIKATRNTVPVPRHWNAKRKYLQGKRGFEKPPFELPDYIKRTGIQTMREAVQEKDDGKSLKQKMREKARPKVGRIDIDYQKLHDAFFKWQTKPRMTIHGDLYYEGKELELKLKEKKPGNLSDDLRTALGMPTGPNADKVPPPWLIAMQRYGPPPSYPNLKIPGLNAPIPESCSFGYHAGGWGKPPVDEFGRPLYGDVFGNTTSSMRKPEEEENIETTLWGEMEENLYEDVVPDEDEEEGEEDEEGKEGGDDEESAEAGGEGDDGLKTPGEGLITPSGTATSVSAGLETPDMIELRKRRMIEAEMEMGSGAGGDDEEAPVLYKILPEKATNVGASMMGSSKVYDISAAKKITTTQEDGDGSFNVDSEIGASELKSTGGQETADLVKSSKRKKETSNADNSEKDKKRKKEFKF